MLLLGTTVASLLTIGIGRIQLAKSQIPLTPENSAKELWDTYRWSVHPSRRREAALLMVSQADHDPRRQRRLLSGQGWGHAPLAAVALELSAQATQSLGDAGPAAQLWDELLQRFPRSPSAAAAMQARSIDDPALGLRLLAEDPAHPAALAVATELDPQIGPHLGALHLARWGPSWPGAAARIRQACADNSPANPRASERQILAKALARLGAADAALACLNEARPQMSTGLAIGRALLYGTTRQQRQGETLLVALAQRQPSSQTAKEAARLLSDPLSPNPILLEALPRSLRANSAAVAAGQVRLADGEGAKGVLKRWPNDPASWQLQWDLARQALLEQRWSLAQSLLEQLPVPTLPGPLEGRRRFWLGYSHQRLGESAIAEQHWSWLIRHRPPGYYRWRAQVRLKQDTTAHDEIALPGWQPLDDSDPLVNTLWRLGLVPEAWDTWRSRHLKENTDLSSRQQLVEGRLRIARGDTWIGLDQLWRLSLRWLTPTCLEAAELHQSQFPRPLSTTFQQAADTERVPMDLLLAIAKQESRFAPGVASIAGAQGLMQLMPATAEELAERPLSITELRRTDLNTQLAARYLHDLLELWDQDPVLAIASYNAGPGNTTDWLSEEATEDPELWIERIPFPETRYYVKKVLANWVGYREPLRSGHCQQQGTGQSVSKPNAQHQPTS